MQYGVIVAGGKGTRLWPLSREARPKQLLEILEGRSLLQLAYDRLTAVLPPERIYVCTSARDADAVRVHLTDLPPDNIIGEPVGRDTANAIGLCSAVLGRDDPDAVIAFVNSDHVIEPVTVFAKALARAFELAGLPRRLVTFGVVPTRADTTLGYVERGAGLDAAGESGADGGEPVPAYTVTAFVEKPDAERAQAYLDSGRYLWNSGMFVWRADTLLDQLSQRLPDTYAGLREIAASWDSPAREAVLGATFAGLTAVSIDYAVMEPASLDESVDVVVVPLALDWIDVGSWPSLASVLPHDAEGNALRAVTVLVDSARNIIVSDNPQRLVATIGLNDTVIVDTADVTLVCPVSEAPRLKELVAAVGAKVGPRVL